MRSLIISGEEGTLLIELRWKEEWILIQELSDEKQVDDACQHCDVLWTAGKMKNLWENLRTKFSTNWGTEECYYRLHFERGLPSSEKTIKEFWGNNSKWPTWQCAWLSIVNVGQSGPFSGKVYGSFSWSVEPWTAKFALQCDQIYILSVEHPWEKHARFFSGFKQSLFNALS